MQETSGLQAGLSGLYQTLASNESLRKEVKCSFQARIHLGTQSLMLKQKESTKTPDESTKCP